MRLFKRGEVWFCWFYVEGRRTKRSTRCHDRKAAEVVAKQWERDGADPDHAAANQTTLGQAVTLLIKAEKELATAGKRSAATVSFYEAKCGHWNRVLGAEFKLAKLSAAEVDRFISTRRTETAAENTIAKELVALRKTLKLAKRRGLWRGDIGAVLPIAFAPEYKPRTRWLPADELQKLLAQLTPDHAARVAFAVATSANWRETELAKREDIDTDMVLLRGTKTATRFRRVPIQSDWGKRLIAYVRAHAQGEGGSLFRKWTSVRMGLIAACERAGIAPCTPNDLRRTFAKWMRAEGMPIELIAPAMGHVDTTMVQKVYGKLTPDELGARMAQHFEWDTGGTKNWIKKRKATRVRNGDRAKLNEYGEKRESGRNRTVNLRIKSPLLCQLSYAPAVHRPSRRC